MSSRPQGQAPLTERVVPFRGRDGMACSLINVRGTVPPARGPVILVHGAGVRASLFRPPGGRTIVDYLVARGYDDWLENWRASIEVTPNPWTLDQAAVLDHPEAVRTIVSETGCDRVKAVVHCQGSCSFVMSLVAGLIPEVDVAVSNAVSLHPIVPFGSRLKLQLLLPFIGAMTDFVDPRRSDSARAIPAKLIAALARATHRYCGNSACRQANFIYGSGDPALWQQPNIDAATHEWLHGEFGHVPLAFFRQMAHCVRLGRLVPAECRPELPLDFFTSPPRTDARFALFAGSQNRCFLPESQVASFDFLDRHRRKYHSLYLLPGYGHLDVFLGSRAADEIFPLIAKELERPAPASQRSARHLTPAVALPVGPTIAAPPGTRVAS
jgi:hypothetical protein